MPDPRLTFPYASLSDVIEAYRTGRLDRKFPLVIGQNRSSVTIDEGNKADGSPLHEIVFEGGPPESLLEQALDALDIPWTTGNP
jgi:hypothetical protein